MNLSSTQELKNKMPNDDETLSTELGSSRRLSESMHSSNSDSDSQYDDLIEMIKQQHEISKVLSNMVLKLAKKLDEKESRIVALERELDDDNPASLNKVSSMNATVTKFERCRSIVDAMASKQGHLMVKCEVAVSELREVSTNQLSERESVASKLKTIKTRLDTQKKTRAARRRSMENGPSSPRDVMSNTDEPARTVGRGKSMSQFQKLHKLPMLHITPKHGDGDSADVSTLTSVHDRYQSPYKRSDSGMEITISRKLVDVGELLDDDKSRASVDDGAHLRLLI